ncbi:MAG: hypothetical protein ACR2OO_02085 [Thermomicrobiales bacterium]
MGSYSKRKDATVALAVDLNDGVKGADPDLLNVTYRPHFADAEWEDGLNALNREVKDSDEPFQAHAVTRRTFLALVAKWDLKMDEDDDAPIPLTDEGLRPIAKDDLDKVMELIQADRGPKAGKTKTGRN